MSLIYSLAMLSVSLSILWLLVDAVISVSRKPQWEVPVRSFAVVTTVEQRVQPLPFVGADRRRLAAQTHAQDKESCLAA